MLFRYNIEEKKWKIKKKNKNKWFRSTSLHISRNFQGPIHDEVGVSVAHA